MQLFKRLPLFILLPSLVSTLCADLDRSDATDLAPLVPIEEFADGARVRAVWVRSIGNPADTGGWDGRSHQLVGFDSKDGLGERLIIGEPANFFRPMITHDGERIVYSNRHTHETFMINFDGSENRLIGQGVAAALWMDDETGREYVIAQLDPQNFESPLIQYVIGEPKTAEVVWDKAPVQIASPGSFQVSRDGKRFATVFPWPHAGMAELPNVAWKKATDGCWPGMVPDNSYISFIFEGAHRFLVMFDPDASEPWKVRINNLKDLARHEVYHPRWSNHPHFITLTGPYSEGEGNIKIGAGGKQVEVYAARLDPELREVVSWARITNNEFADFFPDVWIEGGRDVVLKGRQHSGEKLIEDDVDITATWPGSSEGLEFFWENNRATNQIPGAERKRRNATVEAHGAARFGPRYDMDLGHGGYFSVPKLPEELLKRCKESNEFSVEAVITPASLDQDGPARIATFSKGRNDRNFTLGQEDDRLVFRLRTSNTGRNGFDSKIAQIKAGHSYHVIVSYEPGAFRAFVNGEQVLNSTFETGDFSTWIDDGVVLFGNEKTLDRGWDGQLEGIAIYSRAIGPQEAARKAQLYGIPKPAAQPDVVSATRLSRHDPPKPADIAPYRRALSINTFKVDDAADSPLAGETIHVAEWTLLDGEIPASYSKSSPGERVELHLDLLDDHPQLESERLILTGDEPVTDFYYNRVSGG